ncbi:MAG: polysaccharide biosynthesis/export family protein [Pyrinomonadaceae bacterium]
MSAINKLKMPLGLFAFVLLHIILGAVTAFGQNYKIGPGDVIDVNVTQSPQLTRTAIRVNNQGTIQLSMLDEEIPAACRSEKELAEQIKERYKKFLLNPNVMVSVQQFNSSPVAVIGAVNAPGRFQLQKPVRVSELLTFVNGTAQRAGASVEIMRNRSMPYCNGSELVTPASEGDELISLNLADVFSGGETANPYVRAGDIVRIADAEIAQAYIIGNVKNAKAIPLNEPVTLSRAIAMADGLAAEAQSDKILIRREMKGSVNRTEIVANLKEINLRKKDDILLQANDIVEVPGPKKSFLRDLFKGYIPTIMSMPMRVMPGVP